MTKGRLMVRPAEVALTIHAPVPITGVPRGEVPAFAERVRGIVARHAR
jgi:hypothetical protein